MKPRLYRCSEIGGPVALLLIVCLVIAGCGQTAQPRPELAAQGVVLTPTLTPLPPKPGETGIPTPFPPATPVDMNRVAVTSDPGFDATPVPDTSVSTPLPTDPYHLVIQATYAPGTIQDTAKAVGLIITGTVVKVGPARWTTPDGLRPVNPHSDDNRHYIFTPVTVQVHTVLKGDSSLQQVLVLAIGGQVGQDSVEWAVDDKATFKEQERVVLYLDSAIAANQIQAASGQPLWTVADRYTITANGQAVNSYREMPLDQLLQETNSALGR